MKLSSIAKPPYVQGSPGVAVKPVIRVTAKEAGNAQAPKQHNK